jgi:hypothetical protein
VEKKVQSILEQMGMANNQKKRKEIEQKVLEEEMQRYQESKSRFVHTI